MGVALTYSPFTHTLDTIITTIIIGYVKWELLQVDKPTGLEPRNGKKSCLHHLTSCASVLSSLKWFIVMVTENYVCQVFSRMPGT